MARPNAHVCNTLAPRRAGGDSGWSLPVQTHALYFLRQCCFGCSYLCLCRIQRQEERLKRRGEKRLKRLARNDGHSERIGLRRPSATLFTDTPTIPVPVGGGPLPVLGRGSDRGERRPSATALSGVRPRGGSGSGIPTRAPAAHSRNTAARTLKIVQSTIQVTCAEDRTWAWPVSWTQAHRRSRRRRRRTCASANARAARRAGMERGTCGRFGSVPCCRERPRFLGGSHKRVSDGRVSGGAAAAARRPETKR